MSSEVLTSEQLLAELIRLAGLLEMATDDLKTKAHDESKTESQYRAAKATAYLSAQGTIKDREAHVDKVCTPERDRYYSARAEHEGASEYVRSLRAQLSAYQSICASFRSEAELAGRGTYR